ncbi:hypothetical protein PTTG_27612 [Puccinia triticina 1-1 BBBD Race 1]|uniref:Uncharacterized protein n=2 Tax=Puccinia triticina TaxID=208348 RepID=A0A180GJ46_PUCT1|nr:uncharacterized protein PtA15_18A18 [Puccinia triticina]OAV92459.1 hypothetical protein PTTG_27612 [Puccinia triticina 1-1 BBBD Race 1]WAQ92963.1 hypothetical protein PtA15_18A18 [Puccinia triticina]WAR62943.1 hypothetical protein PtB15_18B25 [Puccinia triticina]
MSSPAKPGQPRWNAYRKPNYHLDRCARLIVNGGTTGLPKRSMFTSPNVPDYKNPPDHAVITLKKLSELINTWL